MTSNPYQSPPALPDEPTIGQPASRPIGISILAILHALGGLLFGALLVFLTTQYDQTGSLIGWMILVVGPPLTILAIATAVGLWRGHKWAWWVATCYYLQFVIGGVFVLTAFPIGFLLFDTPFTDRSAELLVKHLGRIVIFSLLTWYMMKRSVFAFFGFQRLTRTRAIFILLGVVLLIAVLMALPVFIALSMGARLI